MITPELIEYIRGEFAKGKTREEIRGVLVAEGKWSEEDLSEAFRTVIPMQGFAESPVIAQNSYVKKSKLFWGDLVFLIIAILCIVTWWFYRPQIIDFWNSSLYNAQEFYGSYFDKNATTETDSTVTDTKSTTSTTTQSNIVVAPTNTNTVNVVKNCGTGTAPDLKDSSTYQNSSVLTCLGNSALSCENAKAVLNDPFFPTIFQIIKSQDTCDFRLSYPDNSNLVDITGQRLAGQYILCPVGIVKAVDESKSTPSFSAPSVENLGKYASQIYFYGTLGLFIETNLDQNKIQSLGCSGGYISSVIASYNKMQSQQ